MSTSTLRLGDAGPVSLVPNPQNFNFKLKNVAQLKGCNFKQQAQKRLGKEGMVRASVLELRCLQSKGVPLIFQVAQKSTTED